MKNYLPILALLILFSCNENSKKVEIGKDRSFKNQHRDKLVGKQGDTIYKRKWIEIDFGNGNVEETEIYVSNFNDTVVNQFKFHNNNSIDIKQSEYYDLEIFNTNRVNFYKGKITLHTVYENLRFDKANRRTLEFAYCEQTKDSIRLKYIETTTSNTIEFEFQNYYGKRLQGKLYQLVFRDTIIKGKEMLNMRQTNILVDNYPETTNFFLGTTADIKKKRFNPGKIKLMPKS